LLLNAELLAFLFFALSPTSARALDWRIKWSDEFSGPASAAPDASKWAYEEGGGGWGNHELENYCAPATTTPPCDTSRPSASLDGQGHLVIEASRDAQGRWTSARMKSAGRVKFRYGRIEARLKLPVGAGLWPAFWLLGSDIPSVGWPQCGEIDVMENIPGVGDNPLGPDTVRSTLHGEGYSQAHGLGRNFTFPGGGRVDTDFHVYGVIWSKDKMQFYVDDWRKPYFMLTAKDVPNGSRWQFNKDFFILLNLAVGGDWPGPPGKSTPDPAKMIIDYVRVYEPTDPRIRNP
jgi:beta-glucanase (GH16 family)